MILTSVSSPLRIDSVVLDQCAGLIGMTLCPGKKEANAISGDWARDLDIDLMAIKEWGASAIVSLMEREEMACYGVADMPAKATALGMTHLHLPIADMDIPDVEFERNWVEDSERLRKLLLAGKSIVIHCLGGLGRTGTIAARLLIVMGADPEFAIRRVRATRPGTIQTILQEIYVRRCKPIGS